MMEEGRRQVQAELVETSKRRFEETGSVKPRKGRIVDETEKLLGRGLILTGVSKPKEK